MPLEPTPLNIWISPTPLRYALEHPDEPVQVWTPPRWTAMTQTEAGTWWTTVPVPPGSLLVNVEDYRARLLWLMEVKMSQFLMDMQAEGMTSSQAIALGNRMVNSVLPEAHWMPGGENPLARLLNLDYSPLRELLFPQGVDEFPVRPEAMTTSTLSMITESWNLLDWLNNLQALLMEDSRW
jgi:hypothetical protein